MMDIFVLMINLHLVVIHNTKDTFLHLWCHMCIPNKKMKVIKSGIYLQWRNGQDPGFASLHDDKCVSPSPLDINEYGPILEICTGQNVQARAIERKTRPGPDLNRSLNLDRTAKISDWTGKKMVPHMWISIHSLFIMILKHNCNFDLRVICFAI